MSRCKELLNTAEYDFRESLICCSSLEKVDLHHYSQLQGHIQTLRNIIDIKDFLKDEIERLDENERDSTRTQSFIEDGNN